MRFLTPLLLALALLATPTLSLADSDRSLAQPGLIRTYKTAAGSVTLLDDVALNATAATRTITLNTFGLSKVCVLVFYTYAAATTLVATPSVSADGTNYASVTSRNITAGSSTVSVFADTYTTGAADADLALEFDVTGKVSLKVVFSGASAGASDLIDVQAVGMRD